MITEPNRFLELLGLGNSCELWTIETLGLPYRNVLGIIFGSVGEGKYYRAEIVLESSR